MKVHSGVKEMLMDPAFVYRIVAGNAILIKGLYRVHHCATVHKVYSPVTYDGKPKRGRGRIPASVVRAQRRHRIPVSSGRE